MSGVVKHQNKDYKNNSAIKWNFTKFLIDREGHMVVRFEPMTSLKKGRQAVEELI